MEENRALARSSREPISGTSEGHMKSHQLARLMAGVCAAAATFGGANARADDGHWAFAVGADYTNGDYGEAQDTTIYQIPLSAGYTSDRFSVSVTVPYVHLKGSGH